MRISSTSTSEIIPISNFPRPEREKHEIKECEKNRIFFISRDRCVVGSGEQNPDRGKSNILIYFFNLQA